MVHSNSNTIKFFLKMLTFLTALFVVVKTIPALKPVYACTSECGGIIPCSSSVCWDCTNCSTTSKGEVRLGIFKGLGPLSDFIDNLTPNSPAAASSVFSKFISTVVGVMTVVAFIWFIFTFFTGAIAWLSSGGDKQKLQNAQKQITTGLTGLIIVISAIFLIKIVGAIFGFDILDIAKIISDL